MTVSDPLSEQLPQLDMMISAIESEEFDDLYDHYAELDLTFGNLYGTYVDELQYLAADEPQNEVAEQIGARFAEIQPFMAALRDDLSLEEFDAALETLGELKDETITLYSLFADYRHKCNEGPRFSEIPYTHELIRVGRHYLNGDLAIEAVQGRFEVFCQYHDALEQQMSTAIPSPTERATFEENAEDLEEALGLQLQGIEDLDFALERVDETGISEALDLLAEAGEVLVEIYRSLQKADLEPPSVSCIRCGAANSTEAKICGECGAVLPQSAATGPTSTIALEEDGSSVGPAESEEVAVLQKAVDSCIHGGDQAALNEALAAYQKKIERIKRQFSKLESPPADIPAGHLELLQRAKAVFAEAINELDHGIQLLTEGAANLDHLLLEDGMERLRAGTELFGAFQQDFQEAEELTNS